MAKNLHERLHQLGPPLTPPRIGRSFGMRNLSWDENERAFATLAARAPPAIPLPSQDLLAMILPEEAKRVTYAGSTVKIIHTLQICVTNIGIKVSSITKLLHPGTSSLLPNTFTDAWLNRNANTWLFPVVFSKECATVVDKFLRAPYSGLNCSAVGSGRGWKS